MKGGDRHANIIVRQEKFIRNEDFKGNVNLQQQIIVSEFTTKYIISLHSTSSSSSPNNTTITSGRGGRFFHGQGGRGRGRDIKGRGSNSSTVINQKKGLCAILGDNIFTYNKKLATDQLAIKICQIIKHIGNFFGQEISNEIHNQTAVIIVKPFYDQEFLDKQVIKEG